MQQQTLRIKPSTKFSETSRQRSRIEDDAVSGSVRWGSRQGDSQVRNTSGDRRSTYSGANAPSPRYTDRNYPFKEVQATQPGSFEDSKRLRMEKEQLSAKCSILMNKLRQLAPQTDDSLYQLIEQTDARIQHLEENMKVKRQRILGHYKMKALNLLERFGYKAAELNLQNVRTEIELIELLLGRFTDRDLEAEEMWLAKQQEAEQAKMEQLKMQDQLGKSIRQLKLSKLEQDKLRQELDQAHGELSSMAKTLNGRRIEQTLKVERQRISFDRERISDDIHRTKTSMKEMEQYYQDQLRQLQRRNNDLEVRLSTATKELMDERLKYSQCKLKLQEMCTELQQAHQHTKIEREATEKMHRQALRWKERFEQLDKKGTLAERTPPIEYRNKEPPAIDRNRTITRTEASGLYDRRVLAPDDRALGNFLDKEIKKLETDLLKKGLLTTQSKLGGSRVSQS